MLTTSPRQLFKVKIRLYNVSEPNIPSPNGMFQGFYDVDAPLDIFGLPDLNYWLTRKEIDACKKDMIYEFHNPTTAFRDVGQTFFRVIPSSVVRRRRPQVERQLLNAETKLDSDRKEIEVFRNSLDIRLNRLKSIDEQIAKLERQHNTTELVRVARDRLETLTGLENDDRNIERLTNEMNILRQDISRLGTEVEEVIRIEEHIQGTEGIANENFEVTKPRYGAGRRLPEYSGKKIAIKDIVIGASSVAPIREDFPHGAYKERLMVIKQDEIDFDSGELNILIYVLTDDDETRWRNGE